MMNKKILFLMLCIVVLLFMFGCAQQDRQTGEIPAPKEEMNEISPAQEVNTTSIEAPAENNQPEEKVELTFKEKVWKQRIDAAMAPSYCPPVTKVEYPDSYYQGPLIDSHYHLPSLSDSLLGEEEVEEDDLEPYLGKDIKMSEIACTLQHEGTTRNFAFFPFYSEEIAPHALEVVRRTEEQYPDLFTPFTDMPNVPEAPEITSMKAGQMLEQTIKVYPALFQGWGEISLYVLKSGAGQLLPPDSTLLAEIYPILKKHKMMVYFHPGENQRESFERILQQYPEINFIVHGDQIKDDIDYLMGKYPNIYFTINNFYANQDIFLLPNGEKSPEGKKYFFAALKNYEPLIQKDLRTWESLIEAHPDQIMWGLDRDEEVLWTFDRDVGLKLVDYARAFIGRLDPSVQEKFAYKNAEKLLQT